MRRIRSGCCARTASCQLTAALPSSAMKLRRFIRNCPSRTSLPKGSVVRHSKIGLPMTLWVSRVGSTRSRGAGHVRFAPKATVCHKAANPSLMPKGDSCGAANEGYSITSSARPSSESGNVIPSALAVLRLIKNSTLVACCTGRSAALSPLRMRPVYTPAKRYASAVSAP